MKHKIILTLTFICLFIAGLFALGSGTGVVGFVTSDASQAISVNQIFSASFLFLGMAIFIIGLLHD